MDLGNLSFDASERICLTLLDGKIVKYSSLRVARRGYESRKVKTKEGVGHVPKVP